MRRFASRLAVYFGLKDDDAPGAEPASTLFSAVAIVIAALAVGFASELVAAATDGSDVKFTDAAIKAAVFSLVMLLARVVEHHVKHRSTDGPPRADPPARTGRG
jgi:hypothetical protein